MATGGVENETLDKDICNCTICLDTFKVPKILPCLHTFCQSCLSTYILSTKGETSPPDYFCCPVCRTEVKPPNPKAHVEEWAKLLPLNQTIATLVDNSATGEELDEKKCDPCQRDGEVAQAEFWCFECEDGLCQVCHKYHKRMKSFTNHRSVPILDLNKEELQSKLTNIEEPCFEHPGEYLKVYCVDHEKMCCVLCLSIDHRKCENIKTFDQMTESLEDTGAIQNLAKTMNAFSQKMEELIIKKQENIDVIEHQKQDILEDVVKAIEQAKEKLDKCHENFKIYVSQTHKEQTTKLVETKDRFEIFQKSIWNCEKMLHTVIKYGSPKQIFITSEKIKERLEIQLNELQDLLQKDEYIAFDINIDNHLTEMNNTMKLIAELQLKKTQSNALAVSVHSFFPIGNKQALLQRQLKSATIYDLEATKIWDVKGGGCFTDAVFLRDGTLMCVDLRKKRLLAYDNQGNHLFSHPVDYYPWGIVQSSDGRIFVSDSKFPVMRVYTMGHQTLQQINHIVTTEMSFSVNIIENHILTTSTKSAILLAPNGPKHSRSIGKCNQYSFAAVSKTEPRCFYCCDGDCVVKYTLDGNATMRHRLQNIISPRGIAVDNAGNIYVCGKDSCNVSIISENDRSSRIFLSKEDGFQSYSIGFDHTGTRFFLTSNGDAMTVFKLGVKTKHL